MFPAAGLNRAAGDWIGRFAMLPTHLASLNIGIFSVRLADSNLWLAEEANFKYWAYQNEILVDRFSRFALGLMCMVSGHSTLHPTSNQFTAP
jgi:hypothetical protein